MGNLNVLNVLSFEEPLADRRLTDDRPGDGIKIISKSSFSLSFGFTSIKLKT